MERYAASADSLSHCELGYGWEMGIPGHLKIELEEERIRALTTALSQS